MTVCSALMPGLGDVLAFGKQFAPDADNGDGVELRFTDGTATRADVLIGADGVGSRVRDQLMADFEVVDIRG